MNTDKISEKLVNLRGDRKQKDVADAIGVVQSAYSMYESGERIPSDEVKIRLAKYFNTTVQYLFYED